MVAKSLIVQPSPMTIQKYTDNWHQIHFLDSDGIFGICNCTSYDELMEHVKKLRDQYGWTILWVGRVSEQHWPPPVSLEEQMERTEPAARL